MKKIFMLFAIVFISLTAIAQENNNRLENGDVVRGPYLTNTNLFDNTFVGVGGGVNTFVADGINYFPMKPGINANTFIGKWFTPTIGARIGYRGLTNFVEHNNKYWQHYAHGDVMWNISNTIGGYKETRLWNVVPYASFGVLDVVKGNKINDLEYALGFGIYNDIRFNNRINFFLDINSLVTKAAQYNFKCTRFGFVPSASIGIVIKLGKNTGFKRSSSVVANYYDKDAYDKLVNETSKYADKVKCLENKNQELSKKVDSLNKIKPEIKEVIKNVDNTVLTVYFDKGKFEISDKELEHIGFFANNVSKDKVIKVIGSADSETGTPERNKFLSEQRALAVKNVLINKYGFKEENIIMEISPDIFENTPSSRVAVVK